MRHALWDLLWLKIINHESINSECIKGECDWLAEWQRDFVLTKTQTTGLGVSGGMYD